MRVAIDGRLGELVPASAESVAAAMHAAVTSPGKRLRAILVLLIGEAGGRSARHLVELGCVIELVHAASLVLDDLPCMDDAELRRGLPTIHRRFGEAVAILAAFALLSTAQADLDEALGNAGVAPAHRSVLGARFAEVVRQLCRGQAADLSLGGEADLERLERIHSEKTGALFELAAELGAVGAGIGGPVREALLAYARNLGLAFQVGDDVLDASGTPESLGKQSGRDEALRRTTFVSVFGVEGATTLRDELLATARQALTPLGTRANRLLALADHVRTRTS
jgi:geranylgeranyl diphosphate synthase type II